MKLTEKEITTYQELFEKLFKEKISREEVRRRGIEVVQLIKSVLIEEPIEE